ncbi:MAG: hypothetical protein DHS20C21_21950 [Gemmatimonadota bacterium]|nr:MAG: hypothetical protein DHS20C21_21950 [Gemmatimonadota bacterium]
MHRFCTLAIAAALALCVTLPSPAQSEGMDDVSWYALGGLNLPFGNFGDLAGIGFGGGIGAKKPYNEQVTFRGEAGYTRFAGKDFGTGTSMISYTVSMIPVVALAEWHFDPAADFYGLGGLGYFHMSIDVDAPAINTGFGSFSASGSTSDGEIGLVAGGGMQASPEFAIEARLILISDGSQIAANATYTF